jgi:NAD-dependent dihydropyrimidine dehydrogenase PreA subunit
MSLLLKDSVYIKEAKTAKRGVYPMHGYKLGLYRLPIKLEDPVEIQSIHDGLKKTFDMDMYADRIYATYRWTERKGEQKADLSVTVEIVTGEVVDIIYQIFPIEKFGDHHWITDYRKKSDHYAKLVIDTMLRNTILADKMISYYVKTEKISEIAAIEKLEELTPLAKIVLGAKAKALVVEEEGEDEDGEIPIPDGAKPGPIDVEFKSKMKLTKPYDASGYKIKTWGRRGENNGTMGIWGEFVSVDYDICIADGGCIEACPVDVYEWFDTPGNPASDKKPLMAREPDCIFCLACEGVCPPQAIKIFEAK